MQAILHRNLPNPQGFMNPTAVLDCTVEKKVVSAT